jgi:predicted ester cyclase
MTLAENKAIVLRHLKDVLEAGRVELIDSCFAPQGSDSHWGSPEQWKERVLFFHRTCPGFKVNILDMTAEDDKVIVTIQFDLTYSVPQNPPLANFMPFGKPVSWRNLNFFRIVDGKIVATYEYGGWTNTLLANGVIPVKQIDQNKVAAHKFFDGLNRQDAALLAEVCTPEVAKPWTDMLPRVYARFKEHHVEVVDMVADAEMVAVKMATSGYHTGEAFGLPATGKWWTNHGNGFLYFSDGKISRVDFVFDIENHIKQLGGSIQPTESKK